MSDPETPIEDIKAADDFRRTLLDRRDAEKDGAPLWHGWALSDAFLAGVRWAARERK